MPLFRTDVRFTCAPENVDRLMQAVNVEIRAAQDRGFSAEQMARVKTAQRRALEVATRNNGYWLSRLTEHYRFGTDPRLILASRELIDAVDAERCGRGPDLLHGPRPAAGHPAAPAGPPPPASPRARRPARPEAL